ncbi:MAG: hypothetical protein ABIS20_03550 [Thermoanaerobaculia bacterium]
MIDLVESRRALAGSGSVREQVEGLMSRLPAAEACAVVEHLFGVLPLLDGFFEPRGAAAEVASGPELGSLGLFTPAPEPGWAAAAVAGEPAGAGLLLRGEVRIPGPASGGSIVLARLAGGEHRLAWLDHGAPGVERRGSRPGGPVRAGSPCWLALEGAAAGPDRVSRPVTPAPGSDLFRHLESYAGIWALAAAIAARDGVRALRRAARLNGHQGTAFSASQTVALDIAGVEIEMELTLAAAQRHLASGEEGGLGPLTVAAAAARTLAAVAARTAELRDLTGLEIDGPLAGGSAATLSAFLGGPAMIESELARALGIRDLAAQETGG